MGIQDNIHELEWLSPHFNMREFLYSETALKHQIFNCPDYEEILAIRELVKRLLEPLRIAYGKPIRISSGYRCEELNRLVGGVPSSQHIKGEAADCVVDDPEYLLHLLRSNNFPFDQVIWYRKRGFIHISLRKDKLNRKRIRIV